LTTKRVKKVKQFAEWVISAAVEGNIASTVILVKDAKDAKICGGRSC
jgi:hypothetical protein